ncbi:MAG TPA: Ig-like domain-containing protein [Gemmatimonadales bacterium]|nr:Ig-like domain-containing protein [Gemmatimonadales bacterium]
MSTGANGQAGVEYTLSTTAGQQIVEAHAAAIEGPAGVAVFVISAAPEAAVALTPVAGDSQSAQVSTALPESLAVRAVDRFGNGVPGVEVTWEVRGGGQVSPTSVITGPDGRAATARILGDRPGEYEAIARAEGLDGSVSFSALAVAPPRPELVLVTQPSSEVNAGVPFHQQPELQLQDPFGAPLSQENVRVSVQIAEGGGSLGGSTSARSDVSGRVRFTNLELRGETGDRRLIFAAEGFTPVTSAEITVHPGPPAAGQSTMSAPNGTAGVATSITIRLRDEFGNSITGAAGDLSIRVSGANEALLPVTEDGGGTYASSYVPLRSGTDELTLLYRGEPLDGPAESLVVPGASDPSTSTAEVTRSGVLFVQVTVLVTVRDAQGNPVGRGGDLVQISANGSALRTCVPNPPTTNQCRDNGDGTYSDQFIIIANAVTVDITLNGVPLAGSPYSAQ